MKKGIFSILKANIIQVLATLITGFVVPKLLNVDDYGYIKLYQLYISYIGVVQLGMVDGIYLKYGGKDINELNFHELNSFYSSFQIVQIIFSLVFVIISVLTRDYIMMAFAFSIVPINMSGLYTAIYQAIGEFNEYSLGVNIQTIVQLLMNLLLLFVIRNYSYQWFVIGYVVVAYIRYGILCKRFHRILHYKYKLTFSINDVKQLIASGIVLMLGNFAAIAFTGIDRIVINNVYEISQFSYYSFSVSVVSLMVVVISPISLTLYNYFSRVKSDKVYLELREEILFGGMWLLSGGFVIKFIINHWLDKYNASVDVIFILMASQLFYIIVTCIYVNLYKSEKKQNRYLRNLLISLAIAIILDLAVIRIYPSINMVACATFVSYFVWFILSISDFKNIPFPFYRIIIIIVLLIIYVILGISTSAVLGLCIYGILMIVMSLSVFRRELRGILELVKRRN